MVAFVGCLAAVAVAAPAGPFMPARAAAAAECEPRHLLQIDHRIAVDPDSPSDVITLAEGTDPVVVAPDGGSAAVWKDPGGTGGAPGELSVVGHDGTVHVLGDVILAPSWSGDSTRLVSQALGSNPFERVIATYTPASVGPLATFVREPLTFGSPVLTADGAAVVWVEETTVSGGTLRWAPAHGGEVREVALPGEFAFGLVPSDEPGRVALVSRFAGGAHLRVLDTDAAAKAAEASTWDSARCWRS